MRLTLEERFRHGLEAALAEERPRSLGVAVSGGSDSTALLLLLVETCPEVELHVATVQHGLRPEAAGEADRVAQLCAEGGFPHRVLRPPPWDGRGNLQAWARSARLEALPRWAREVGLAHVALGHTQDDQAETLLLRLRRGSGVDGLSAMAPRREHGGLTWLRPMLALGREELREWLCARGVAWVEDPSNFDDRFDRVELRRAIALLGLDTGRLAATAERMRAARVVLEARAAEVAARLASMEAGDLIFDAAVLTEPEETRSRLLSAALRFVSGASYRPRYAALLNLASELREGRGGTLAGCFATREGDQLRIAREPRAVAALEVAADEVWDGRWLLERPAAASAQPAAGFAALKCPSSDPHETGPATSVVVLSRSAALDPAGGDRAADSAVADQMAPACVPDTPGAEPGRLTVRALGDGLDLCPDWRASGLPRSSLRASPAVWDGSHLVAAPLAGLGNGWTARLAPGRDRFADLLVSR